MVPNWTTEVYILMSASVILGFNFILMIREFYRDKFKKNLFMALGYLFGVSWSFLGALSHLFMSKLFFQVAVWSIGGMAFFVTFSLDFLASESIDARKVIVISFLFSGSIFSSFEKNSVIEVTYPTGEHGLNWSGTFEITGSLVALVFLLFVFYYYLQIFRKSPQNLKKYSALLLLGGFFFMLSPVFATVPIAPDGKPLHNIIPGVFALVISIGGSIVSVVFVKQPTLAFILPFKAHRLTIIDNDAGIAIFSHTWSTGRDMMNEELYSGMLQGIGAIMKEAIKRGDIRQIETDQACILLEHDKQFPITCAIVATNPSPSLKSALVSFITRFIQEYSGFFSDDRAIHEISRFKDASNLVKECFYFIPEYSD
ncbi:MAG: hypothetical protein ACFFCS_17130 [Candidatus Hodarchaeota archaeon]